MNEMNKQSRTTERIVLGGVLFLILCMGLIFLKDLKKRSIDQSVGAEDEMPVISQVSSVPLTNQFGVPFDVESLKGRIWFADIVFTRCAGPCPEMTRTMARLQARLKDHPDVHFVTLTSDPEYDGPEEMQRFGRKFNADFDTWHFLTGTKKDIYRLCIDDLKLVVKEKEEGDQVNDQDLFIHSTLLVLVDADGRVRASFDGFEDPDLDAMVEAVRILETESADNL